MNNLEFIIKGAIYILDYSFRIIRQKPLFETGLFADVAPKLHSVKIYFPDGSIRFFQSFL